MKKCFNILILILLAITVSSIFPQQNNLIQKSETKKQSEVDPIVFDEIETAIKNADVVTISRYLGPHTYFSLTNGINGYYSVNQAFYVLEDFFKIYRVTKFKFDNIKTGTSNPYGTGTYHFDNRGRRSSAQVYISLTKTGKNWNISQLTIN
jgi:hypothetical protein